MPIIIKIQQPKNLVKLSLIRFLIIFPKYKEIKVIKKEIQNKISFAICEIFVFFIPYVIPIPRESILLDIAKISVFRNMYYALLRHNMTKSYKS